jgi:hypothetical protein
VTKFKAYADLPQPGWHKIFPHPLLNSVERKPLVRVSATLGAEDRGREAISALPLELTRHTALAHSCIWDTLGTEEAT